MGTTTVYVGQSIPTGAYLTIDLHSGQVIVVDDRTFLASNVDLCVTSLPDLSADIARIAPPPSLNKFTDPDSLRRLRVEDEQRRRNSTRKKGRR